MSVYQKRLLAAVLWLSLFLIGFLIDGTISNWQNQFTLSKILLWIGSFPGGIWFSAMGIFGMGLLAGHLYSPQNSILGPAAEYVKRSFSAQLKATSNDPIVIGRISAKAFVDEVETMKS